jgi:hypothetical protein
MALKDIVCPQTPDIKIYLPGLKDVIGKIRSMFEAWSKNFEFREYISDIQIVLNELPQRLPMPERYSIPTQEETYQPVRAYFNMADLFQNPAPELPLPQDELKDLVTTNDQPEVDKGPSKLKSLLTKLSKSAKGHYEKAYTKDLQKSQNAFVANTAACPRLTSSPYALLKKHLEQCKGNVDSMYKKICSRLIVPSSPSYDSARQASMLPRLSPSILLRLLARFNPVQLSPDWKVALIRYALAIAYMQRAERLVACGKRDSEILNELTNGGHTNWDPTVFPEWLLLEIESNILIRPEQGK